MNKSARIVIAFTDWWLSGTGRAGSGDVDAVPHLDRFDCPALPMTQVKGQLKETAERLATDGAAGWAEELVLDLFGGEGRDAALAFRGDATIDPEVGRWFALNAAERNQLSRRRASTRIGPLGAAADQTLRAVHAAVPLTLVGDVVWIDANDPAIDWVKLLDAACAATLAFGKLKTDGYGRAIARCEAVS